MPSSSIRRRLEIVPRHIAGEANDVADRLSRNIATDRNEWKLTPTALSLITRKFGRPTIDWFASDATAQCPRFASLTASPRALYRDAMQTSWANEFGLFVPPINLIGKVLARLSTEPAHGVLVVPNWPSAPWAASLPWLRRSEVLHLPPSSMLEISSTMRDGRQPPLVAFRV